MNYELSEIWLALAGMLNNFLERLPYIAVAAIVFLIFFLLGKWTRHIVRLFSDRRRRHRNLGIVMGRVLQAVIVLLGVLVGFVIILPSFRPSQLVELLGIGTLAIGFAFRDIFQNFLAGILLLLTEPFRIGDQIRSGEFEGQVEDIQTRATFIRTYDGRRIVIPNGNLFTSAVTVNTAFEIRRLQYDVGVGVSDDIERAKALILEAVRGIDDVLAEPAPDVLVVDLAPSAVKLRVRWWIKPPRRWELLESQDKILTAIKKKLLANGVDLPYETRTILLHDQTEEADGDRTRQREGWPSDPQQRLS